MIDIHAVLRFVFNIGALVFGFKIYSTVQHNGILALVGGALLSALLGLGLMIDVFSRSHPVYHWAVDIIRLLSMVGLYYIWTAVQDMKDDQ